MRGYASRLPRRGESESNKMHTCNAASWRQGIASANRVCCARQSVGEHASSTLSSSHDVEVREVVYPTRALQRAMRTMGAAIRRCLTSSDRRRVCAPRSAVRAVEPWKQAVDRVMTAFPIPEHLNLAGLLVNTNACAGRRTTFRCACTVHSSTRARARKQQLA